MFGHHYEIVWILQALLHTVSAYLIFLSSEKFLKKKGDVIGLIAAALFGLHPDLIEISAMLMTETLYLFLMALVIWLFIKLYRSQSERVILFFLSFATGLAILSRPRLFYLFRLSLFLYFK